MENVYSKDTSTKIREFYFMGNKFTIPLTKELELKLNNTVTHDEYIELLYNEIKKYHHEK